MSFNYHQIMFPPAFNPSLAHSHKSTISIKQPLLKLPLQHLPIRKHNFPLTLLDILHKIT